MRAPLRRRRNSPTTTTSTSERAAHLRNRYRSGLEERVAAFLAARGIPVQYETEKITYTVPARTATYTPDFKLPNGIYVEAKGIFETKDRQKHLLIKDQHPSLDIRFLFSSSRKPIYKGSPTTYADWCRKHGFAFAEKEIPHDWLSDQV